MSRESSEWLNTQTLIGYTDKRGKAWHYRADDQGDEPNHYPGAIPVEDVTRRLFDWDPVEGTVETKINTPDGEMIIVDPDRKTIVRPDTGAILGIFKSGYQVHDYHDWLIHNVGAILDADLKIGSAGLLRRGAVAWVQVEMEDTLEAGGVEFRPFLTAATSLDGSMSTTYQTGAQVVVCDNTLSTALGRNDGRKIKIKHSRHSLGKISSVRDALEIVHGVGDDFQDQVNRLLNAEVDEDRWQRFLDAYTKRDQYEEGRSLTMATTKADALDQLWSSDDRVAPWRGTEWGVISAVNTYTHHGSIVRGADRVTRNMERAVTGKFHALDAKTAEVLATV